MDSAGQQSSCEKHKQSISSVDVSVVLNLHREALYLRPTLLSHCACAHFARQEGLTVQLVAVFDRPDKETERVFSSVDLSAFDSVRRVTVDFGSLGAARNAGILEADGAFIWTADADDLVSKNSIVQLLATAKSFQDDKVAVFTEYYVSFGDKYYVARFERSSLLSAADLAFGHPYGSRIFLRRSVFRNIPYRDLRLSRGFAYEDWDLNARLLAQGFRLEVAPGCAIFYRQRADSLLQMADRLSSRMIPHCELFEPSFFVQHMAKKRAEHPDWDRFLRTRSDLHRIDFAAEFLSSPCLRQALADAASIEPEVNPHQVERASSYCPVPYQPDHWGFSLEDAFGLIGTAKYSDVVLLPWLLPGGAEKYILEVIDLLCAQGSAEHVLFICGQQVDTIGWQERLDRQYVFLDVFNAFPTLSVEARDEMTARLLLSATRQGARLHVKASEFSHRMMDRFGAALSSHFKVIYYRFGDREFQWSNTHIRDDWGIRFLRRNESSIHALISDCKGVISRDLEILPQLAEKAHCIYLLCEPGSEHPAVSGQPQFRLLWASRISAQKRPELIGAIARALYRRAPHIGIEVYGTPDHGLQARDLIGGREADYKGSFSSFEALPRNRFDAIVYTSAYDGLPNILLESMVSGLSVIAPDVGGIAEAVSAETGFLIPNLPNEKALVDAYVDAILELYADWPGTLRKRENARRTVTDRHGYRCFAESVNRAILGDGPDQFTDIGTEGSATVQERARTESAEDGKPHPVTGYIVAIDSQSRITTDVAAASSKSRRHKG